MCMMYVYGRMSGGSVSTILLLWMSSDRQERLADNREQSGDPQESLVRQQWVSTPLLSYHNRYKYYTRNKPD